MAAKYFLITNWLLNKKEENVTITIDELEKECGITFPPACINYNWFNRKNNPFGRSCLKAGYTASLSENDKNTITFVHNNQSQISNSFVRRRTKSRNDIPYPCNKEVEKYLNLWNTLEKYEAQEKSLNMLFVDVYPQNDNLHEVLIKVACLNDFYFTNIFSIYDVAKHIVELKIDERLNSSATDFDLVKDIAKNSISDIDKNFYSFATKYCSHHKPDKYAIFDSYVEEVLKYFRNADHFFEFSNEDLRDYEKFHKIVTEFGNHYGLKKYSLKELDRYLWQLGKDKFPKKQYQKKSEKGESTEDDVG